PSPAPAANPAPAPTPKPIATPSPVPSPVEIREGEQVAQNPQSNFAVPLPIQPAAPSPAPANAPSQVSLPEAVVGNAPTSPAAAANRYLIIVSGVILALLILSDLRQMIEQKLMTADKKINNLALLIISLIVIGFLYWF